MTGADTEVVDSILICAPKVGGSPDEDNSRWGLCIHWGTIRIEYYGLGQLSQRVHKL